MTQQKTSSSLDFEVLGCAVEYLDVKLLASCYAEDTKARFVGPRAPPSYLSYAQKRQAGDRRDPP